MSGKGSKEELISENKQDTSATENQSVEVELEDKWLIRDCEIYEDEYDECTSFKARFQQYFVYGETVDCNQWKRDYDNCCKWVEKKDLKAGQAVIDSEKNRRLERLKAHYQNDTWKKRESPPEDWDKSLPEWMVKRDENTYLGHIAKQMKEGKTEPESSLCSIV